MAPRRVKVNKFDYKKLTANDVICPVCRSILIKPVTLPCSHGFCASCFETTTQNANLVCPLCRVRIGSWLRTASKSQKLINESFWQAIQDLFPSQVKSKISGRPENALEDKLGTKDANRKSEQTKAAAPSSSTAPGLAKTIQKSTPASVFLNNYATKEYTCRILCQSTKDAPVAAESLTLIQRKNKRIQKITESETANDRSNSIESECLYFKPIDYRHNPPSEGLAPIKVPTRKPNVSPNVKILAPCGQNQINMNSLESAFARLFSTALPEEKSDPPKGQGEITTIKRKYDKSDCKSKKKLKSSEANLCDSSCDSLIKNSNNNVKKCTISLVNEEKTKRSLQEKADFELATKLQQSFNQSAKYSTRSSVLKRAAANKQVKIQGIMTPYKVK